MVNITHPYLDAILDWARQEDAIRALVVTGSLARMDDTTDQYSDLDVQVIATDIKRYIEDDRWLNHLGDVWIRYPIHQDAPYRLVWFSGGIKVDFQFLESDTIQGDQLTDEYTRGYQVLLDKDDLFRDLPPSPRLFPQAPPPSAAEVQATINEFWFEAIHVAQFIRRRDFWVVKHRDWTMKANVLRMLEWQTRHVRRESINTWLIGRRIAHWADEGAYAAIERIWAGWDALALWEALLNQLELFSRLSREVASALQFTYEERRYRDIGAYIHKLWREDPAIESKD
ncbi:MAG: aminoglycoside 6-adenylyltransferase [Chloroflexi bacterium]|nr:aminoglycoside 6-adenylyltransferase [Chloroflexota bacterium]